MKEGVDWQEKTRNYLEINLFQCHFIHIKPQIDPRSSNRDLHGRFTTSSKSQSFPVSSLLVIPYTVVTGSRHSIWVIYLRCLVFLSLIFRIQLVFCTLFTTKRSNSDSLNCVKLLARSCSVCLVPVSTSMQNIGQYLTTTYHQFFLIYLSWSPYRPTSDKCTSKCTINHLNYSGNHTYHQVLRYKIVTCPPQCISVFRKVS